MVRGDGVGRTLGYPTANIDIPKSKVLFSKGVYAALATVRNQEYRCALVIRDQPWRVEAHLLDYEGKPDFYGLKMSVNPLQKICAIERVDSREELMEKIAMDIKMVKDYFAEKNTTYV